MTRRLAKTMLAAVAVLATMVLGTIPAAFAQEAAGEITVTGVIGYEGTKADGTPVYGITDASTPGEGRNQQKGYLIEGDYSAYLGERITVHGVLQGGQAERVLSVTRVEWPR